MMVNEVPENNSPVYGPDGQIIGTFILSNQKLLTPIEATDYIEKDVKRNVKRAFPWLMLLMAIPWGTIIRFVIEYLSKRNVSVYIPMGYTYSIKD